MSALTKSELIGRIEDEYAALNQALEAAEALHMNNPIEGPWSAKDIRAHIAAWENVLTEFHISGRPFEDVISLPGAHYQVTPFDEVNEHLFTFYRDWPQERVVEYAQQVHRGLLDCLAGLEEATFQAPAKSIAEIGLEAHPLHVYIGANTFEHYAEHMEALH